MCYQLVSIANREGRHAMTMADLDESLGQVLARETPPMERFWHEFCREPACRDCVEQVLAGEPPTDRAALRRLLDNGYVVADGARVRLRVPLFEDWLRRYRDGA
ncbi:hypothetical protein [uncultured Thiodictyon sp.]|uniref:hypothetical protein n=1 Tax=uncultured Thiodictyon sp. TaxID=1846217 RepID=UPI0025DD33D2|nr:hypothetical protein [uncultured Thiodictyon sp.]